MSIKEPDPIAILTRRLIKYQVLSLVATLAVVASFYVVMTGQGTDWHPWLADRATAMELLLWSSIVDLIAMYRLANLSRRRLILTRVRMFSGV
ncbi:MAG: hypothetical protein ACPHXW_08230 [Marinobacterium sp.]